MHLVSQTIENLVGVELSDDIGQWVTDGVVLCQMVNKLHPGTISTIHTPQPGHVSRRARVKRVCMCARICMCVHMYMCAEVQCMLIMVCFVDPFQCKEDHKHISFHQCLQEVESARGSSE